MKHGLEESSYTSREEQPLFVRDGGLAAQLAAGQVGAEQALAPRAQAGRLQC